MTVALGVAFTLYVSIQINWRFVSPVAYFTAIYMTQYVQLSPGGEPSMLLTFQLRMAALLFGVLVAIVFNMVFSQVEYKHMMKKRILFLLEEQRRILMDSGEALEAGMGQLPQHFADIEWVGAQMADREKELIKLPACLRKGRDELVEARAALKHVKEAAHLIYDISMAMEVQGVTAQEASRIKAQMKAWGQAMKIEKLSYTIEGSIGEVPKLSNPRIQGDLVWIEAQYQKLA